MCRRLPYLRHFFCADPQKIYTAMQASHRVSGKPRYSIGRIHAQKRIDFAANGYRQGNLRSQSASCLVFLRNRQDPDI